MIDQWPPIKILKIFKNRCLQDQFFKYHRLNFLVLSWPDDRLKLLNTYTIIQPCREAKDVAELCFICLLPRGLYLFLFLNLELDPSIKCLDSHQNKSHTIPLLWSF